MDRNGSLVALRCVGLGAGKEGKLLTYLLGFGWGNAIYMMRPSIASPSISKIKYCATSAGDEVGSIGMHYTSSLMPISPTDWVGLVTLT